MLVHIVREYYVEMSPLNVTLRKKTVSKSGKEIFQAIGYFGSIEGAMKACLRYETAKQISGEDGVIELKDAIDIMQNIQTELASALSVALSNSEFETALQESASVSEEFTESMPDMDISDNNEMDTEEEPEDEMEKETIIM